MDGVFTSEAGFEMMRKRIENAKVWLIASARLLVARKSDPLPRREPHEPHLAATAADTTAPRDIKMILERWQAALPDAAKGA